jgi:hypothetical protein
MPIYSQGAAGAALFLTGLVLSGKRLAGTTGEAH